MITIENYSPFRIDIVLSDECNLLCDNCIKLKFEEADRINYLDFITDVVRNLKANRIQIHFTGGEPLLKTNEINDIIQKINEEKSNTKSIDYSLYSNLTFLNDEIIDFLKENNITIHTSIDGPKIENDNIRGSGSFSKTIGNIKKLQNKGCNILSITTTLKSKNFNGINETFVSLIADMEINVWRLNIDYLGVDTESEEIIKKVYEIYELSVNRNIKVEGSWLYPFNNMIKNKKNGFCPATKGESIAILPNGKISLCPYSQTFIGKKESTMYQLEKKYLKLKHTQEQLNKLRCSECFIKDYCQTQCLITVEQESQDLINWYCNIYRSLTYKLLKNYLASSQFCVVKGTN